MKKIIYAKTTENIKFVDGKYTIENASAGETYIFTE